MAWERTTEEESNNAVVDLFCCCHLSISFDELKSILPFFFPFFVNKFYRCIRRITFDTLYETKTQRNVVETN